MTEDKSLLDLIRLGVTLFHLYKIIPRHNKILAAHVLVWCLGQPNYIKLAFKNLEIKLVFEEIKVKKCKLLDFDVMRT
jgi:hypothetical protein